MMTKFLQSFAKWYRAAAVILLNTILLFVLFNLGLWIVFKFRGPEPGTAGRHPGNYYRQAAVAAAYPDFNEQERKLLLEENWLRTFVYEDYTHFKERPRQGKYVNVSEAGFRHSKNQGPWPPDPHNLNVFVFGGSTAFGYGLPDYQTIASWLQEGLSAPSAKKVCVYNFGMGWYYSTQERIQFERLLSDGHRPHIVVFIDGLNELGRLEDVPAFRDQFKSLFNLSNNRQMIGSLLYNTPTGRLMRGLKRRFAKPNDAAAQIQIGKMLERYQTNKLLIEGICRQFSITPIFVWQPVPSYRYDLRYHLFNQPYHTSHHAFGYELMERSMKERPLGDNFIWCADLQENEKECLYVDYHHYNAKFSKKLADYICTVGFERRLLQTHAVFSGRSASNESTECP